LYHAASVALEDREARVAAAAEKVETDLELLGATAVEDKLQVTLFVCAWLCERIGEGGWEEVDTLGASTVRSWLVLYTRQVRKWFKNHQCQARDCTFG
jgi:hypothetical protein